MVYEEPDFLEVNEDYEIRVGQESEVFLVGRRNRRISLVQPLVCPLDASFCFMQLSMVVGDRYQCEEVKLRVKPERRYQLRPFSCVFNSLIQEQTEGEIEIGGDFVRLRVGKAKKRIPSGQLRVLQCSVGWVLLVHGDEMWEIGVDANDLKEFCHALQGVGVKSE